MNPALRWKTLWLGLWIAGMLLGVYLSLRPGLVKEQIIPHLDKIIHAVSYAILAIFAACLFERKVPRSIALLWLVLLSGLIELGQGYLTTTRSMEFADLLANCLGIIAGAWFAVRINVLLFIERRLT